MGVLLASAGALWPWLGIATWGLAAGIVLGRAAVLPWPWPAIAGVPLGLLLYALLLVPALALLPPAAGAAGAAAAGLGALGAVLAAGGLPRPSSLSPPRPGRLAGGGRNPDLASWPAAGVLLALAVTVAGGGARYAQAVLAAAELPPLLGGASTGDWGLHALRVALLAREGVPPPSPLDPDYPLQYRYLFHVLAAAFLATAGGDVPLVAGAVSGLVLGALVAAGGALAYALTRSWACALSAGLLGALYGPTYWLPEAGALLRGGRLPDVNALGALAAERWPLSPLAPSFPSMLTAQGSSPSLPLGVLAWLATLCCLAAARGRPAAGAGAQGGRRWRVGAGALAGVALAVLVFAADFFAPLAALSLALGGALARLRPAASHQPAPGLREWGPLLAGGAGLAAGLLALFGAAGQLGGTGAAGGVRLAWNETVGQTAVYGGNHALLAGGTAVPFPSWVAIHDWGLLFWPGALLTVGVAWWRRDAVLFAGGAAALLTALFWHLCTVVYQSPVPVDFRVQMYRYASQATAVLAPLLPVGLWRLWPAGGLATGVAQLARWGAAGGAGAVGSGAGLYLLAALGSLQGVPAPEWAGDVALARVLAQEPGRPRLAVLNGPASFLEMYSSGRGGNLPLWWGWGAASVPVGWDFGHPERYGPPYRRVVREFAPPAAATLGLTHVAVAPGQVTEGDRGAMDAFLRQCDAVLVGTWGAPAEPAARRLYRIRADACAGR